MSWTRRERRVKKWRIPPIVRCHRLRELYNQMAASLDRFAFWSVPRVHTLRFPSSHPPTNSHPPLQSRYIFQSVRSSGAFANPVIDPRCFIPTDNCISVHCYQCEPWTLVYENIFTIRRYGEDRMYNGRRREEARLEATVFIIAGGRPLLENLVYSVSI